MLMIKRLVVVVIVVVALFLDYTNYGNRFSGPAPSFADTIPIHLTDVACTGSEASLLDCSYRPGQRACSHFEDVGVACIPSDLDSPIFSKKEVLLVKRKLFAS